MKLALRILATLVVVPSVYFFVFWGPFSLLSVPVPWVPSLVSLACAVAVGAWVWRRLGAAPGDLLTSVATGAVITGAAGFCVGFFGPLLWAPDANQGPLLGLFITGPLGLLAGGIGGGIAWSVRRRRAGG